MPSVDWYTVGYSAETGRVGASLYPFARSRVELQGRQICSQAGRRENDEQIRFLTTDYRYGFLSFVRACQHVLVLLEFYFSRRKLGNAQKYLSCPRHLRYHHAIRRKGKKYILPTAQSKRISFHKRSFLLHIVRLCRRQIKQTRISSQIHASWHSHTLITLINWQFKLGNCVHLNRKGGNSLLCPVGGYSRLLAALS